MKNGMPSAVIPVISTDCVADAVKNLISPSVMVNILGEEGYEGEPFIDGIHEALEIPELSFHFYAKSYTKPVRKMGHITVLDDDIDKALEKAMKAKDILKIKGSKKR